MPDLRRHGGVQGPGDVRTLPRTDYLRQSQRTLRLRRQHQGENGFARSKKAAGQISTLTGAIRQQPGHSGIHGRRAMVRLSFRAALLLGTAVLAASGRPALSAPKSAAGGQTDSCEICKHCPHPSNSPTQDCAAACMDCYVRNAGPRQMAPAAPPPNQANPQNPLPAGKAQ